jgi:hypothetical protein
MKKAINTPKSLQEVFKLFCGKDGLRPAMQEPFERNDKVYATDAFILIRCDKSHCDFEITNQYPTPKVESVFSEPNMSVPLKINAAMFDKYFTADEFELIGEDVKCKACDGHGEVEWEYESYTKDDDCPVCDGSGIEDEQKPIKTGRKTIGDYFVSINETHFDMKLFYRIIQAQSFLGGEIVLTHQSAPNKANIFKVGYCDIVLMPTLAERDLERTLVINAIQETSPA